MERMTTPTLLTLMRIRIVAPVESSPQLGIAQHLIRLIDTSHLLLRILFRDSLLCSLVWVILFRGFAVRRLDLFFISIRSDTNDLVVVLCLAALQSDLGLAENGINLASL